MNRYLAASAIIALTLAASAAPVAAAGPASVTAAPVQVPYYRTATIDGVRIAHVEAGPKDAPVAISRSRTSSVSTAPMIHDFLDSQMCSGSGR